jgi:hypothetical protein
MLTVPDRSVVEKVSASVYRTIRKRLLNEQVTAAKPGRPRKEKSYRKGRTRRSVLFDNVLDSQVTAIAARENRSWSSCVRRLLVLGIKEYEKLIVEQSEKERLAP